MAPDKKPGVSRTAAWREARELVWTHRRRLLLGLVLMLVSRLAGLVLPASSKFLIDDVIYKGRGGSAGWVSPRKPRPLAGAGAAALPLPILEEAADELFRMFTADVERRRLSAVGLYRY